MNDKAAVTKKDLYALDIIWSIQVFALFMIVPLRTDWYALVGGIAASSSIY